MLLPHISVSEAEVTGYDKVFLFLFFCAPFLQGKITWTCAGHVTHGIKI